jgi:hypothetical protein
MSRPRTTRTVAPPRTGAVNTASRVPNVRQATRAPFSEMTGIVPVPSPRRWPPPSRATHTWGCGELGSVT